MMDVCVIFLHKRDGGCVRHMFLAMFKCRAVHRQMLQYGTNDQRLERERGRGREGRENKDAGSDAGSGRVSWPWRWWRWRWRGQGS
jgi:hypothetical protein